MIKKILSSENELVFIADATQNFANAWRRAMISEVPVMAITDVEIHRNNSSMFDETLANRLGLLPLKTDIEAYNLPERCSCKGEGCAKCELKMHLKATKQGLVYADAIESKDPKIVPVYPKTPILFLNSGHAVELELTAKLGKGKSHAKYTPGAIFMKAMPKIHIGKIEDADKVIAACPKHIFKKKGNSLEIDNDKLLDCDFCHACVDVDSNVKVETEKDKYVFYIESFGQLKPKDIAVIALDELEIQAKEFENLVKELSKEK